MILLEVVQFPFSSSVARIITRKHSTIGKIISKLSTWIYPIAIISLTANISRLHTKYLRRIGQSRPEIFACHTFPQIFVKVQPLLALDKYKTLHACLQQQKIKKIKTAELQLTYADKKKTIFWVLTACHHEGYTSSSPNGLER